MKKELDYFRIGNSYGGNQDWFLDFMMKIGGCAALTACDSCIYLDLYKGTELYPYEKRLYSFWDAYETISETKVVWR